ncbi:hypothetical protein J7K44_02140 [bacterium]|nr:hypothetical protein [bacterium]
MFNTKIKFPTFNFQFSNLPLEKGVSLYFAVAILSVLLAMTLAITLVVVGQIRIVKGMGDSVVALSAADTGIEAVLYSPDDYATDTVYYGHLDVNDDGHTASSDTSCSSSAAIFPQDSCYAVKKIAPGPDCSATYYCIRSIGYFRGARRAVETTR